MKEKLQEIGAMLFKPVPFSEVLDKKIPLPAIFETQISFSLSGEKLSGYWASLSAPAKQGGKKLNAKSQAPSTFSFEGPVTEGEEAPFAVNGRDITISPDAWVFGEIKTGIQARVSGIIRKNGTYLVTKWSVP